MSKNSKMNNEIGLKYIYGVDRNSVLDTFIDDLQQELYSDFDNSVIVISKNKNLTERYIRSKTLVDKNLRLKILTLDNIFNIVTSKLRINKTNLLGENSRTLIVANILKELEDLKEFSHVKNSMEVANLFSNTIKKFKQERINCKDVENLICQVHSGVTKNKMIDFEIVYNHYESFKEGRFLDKEDAYLRVISNLELLSFLKDSSVYFYGFDGFNNLEMLLVENILSIANQTTVILNTDSVNRHKGLDSGHFYKADIMVENFNNICTGLNLPRKRDIFVPIEKSQKDFRYITEYLYKYPYSVFTDDTEYIHILKHESMYHEVNSIACQILKLWEEGVKLSDIKIVCFQHKEYSLLFKEIFEQFGVPLSYPKRVELNNTHLVKLIRSLFNLYRYNFKSEDVISFLRYSEWITVEEMGKLENYFFINNVEQLNLSIERIDSIESNVQTELEIKVCTKLLGVVEFFRNIELQENSIEKCFELYRFISNIWLSLKELESLEELNTIEEVEIWNAFSSTLTFITNIYNEQDLSVTELFELISYNLSSKSFQVEEESLGSVEIIQDKENLCNCEYLFIVNATEGGINLSEKTESIFNDIDNELLSSCGINIEYGIQETFLINNYHIYTLLTIASQKVFISVPGLNKLEEVLKPAPFIVRLTQLFSSGSSVNPISPADIVHLLPPRAKVNALVNNIEGSNMEFIKNFLTNKEADKEQNSYKEALLYGLGFSNNTSCTDNYNINQLYFSDTFSVSKLEKYNKCPFSYFVEFGLNIKPIDRNIPDSRHIGIFLHEVIELFFNRLTLNNVDLESVTDDYILKEIDDIFTYVLGNNKDHILESSKKYEIHNKKLKEIAIESVSAILKHLNNSFFNSIGHEIIFGEKAKYPPIYIKTNHGKRVKMRGQIDRVDECVVNNKKFIRIIDYKTGDKTINFGDIYHGLQLQLLTYLGALINSQDDKELVPAGVFYFKLDKHIVKATPKDRESKIKEMKIKNSRMKGLFLNESNIPQLMDKDVFNGVSKTSFNINARFKMDGSLMKSNSEISRNDFDTLIKYTTSVIKDTITTMLSGDISISPIMKEKISTCSYCKYKFICHFDESLEDNKYKFIPDYKPLEALYLIRKKVSSCDQSEVDQRSKRCNQ